MSLHSPMSTLPLFAEPHLRMQREEHRLPDPPAIVPPTDKLAAQFKRFHEANPQVYRALADKAEQLLREGRTRIGIAELVEELRYDHRIGTRGEPFKINNNHRAFYSDMLMERIPALRDLIETRVRTHTRKKEGASR
jgi:hypothetical protein